MLCALVICASSTNILGSESEFLFALDTIYLAVPGADHLVETKVGLIRGQAAADGDYYMFLGIPYVKVDVRLDLQFPILHLKTRLRRLMIQPSALKVPSEFDNTQVVGTLDCLHLNVYVPTAADASNHLPVLVWIHGGGYAFGFSGGYFYGPKFLVRHDVILVTLNYRLGPYGFMCLDTPAVPGNQGLKDQKLALTWIKNNIEAFGGDSNKITIFGESAGASSVDFHVHLDQDDLFSQAILQSGTILNSRAFKRANNVTSIQLSEHLGFATSDVHESLSFLASIDPNILIDSSRELGLSFRPCMENKFDEVESFLTDYPINLQAKKIPLLVGFTEDECLLSYNGFSADYFAENDFLRDNLKDAFEVHSHTSGEMSELLKKLYFGDNAINEESMRQVLNFCSDFRFLHPTLRSLTKFFDSGVESIFLNMFSYVGQRNHFKKLNNITYGGASHADELSYLFDIFFVETIMPDEDQIMIDRITRLWTNFAKYGDPTPEISELLPLSWIPAKRDRWNYLNLDSELTMETRPFSVRMAFLDLFYKMYDTYQIGYRG